MQLSIALVIIITAAKAGGYISYRLGQPSVLGELLAGIILGPTVINLLQHSYFGSEHITEMVHFLAEIGVLLLMFIAGMELHLTDLIRSGKVAASAGISGVILPVVMGTGLGLLFKTGSQEAIFIGLILAATSVSISAQTLMELKVLRSKVGISLLGAAVFDDILVVLGLSIFIAIVSPQTDSGWLSILKLVLAMVIFLAIATVFGKFLLPSLSRIVKNLPISQGLIAFTFVTILLYGWAAEEFGNMAAITGAFLAGLFFARSPQKERIESGILPLAYGLFVPIFFINVGLNANLRDLTEENFWLFLAITIVAIISKVLGAGLGGLIGGLNRHEAVQLGIGMMSRGEVGLIVASVGISQGIIPQNIFSIIVGVVIITTLFTPPLLRLSFHWFKDKEPEVKGDNPDLESKTSIEGAKP